MSLRIDHIIYASRDLDATSRRFLDEFGLDSLVGGLHPNWGTGNRIVPLGHDYVELLGVADPVVAGTSPIGRRHKAATADGDALQGWCVATDDLDGLAKRLGLAITAGLRRLPDGRELSWRAAGLEATFAEPSLPFFIEWLVAEDLHPGSGAASHRIEPVGISWVEVGGDPARMMEWLGGDELPVTVTPGPAGLRAVGIETSSGEVVLR
jgi:hypothetical protein